MFTQIKTSLLFTTFTLLMCFSVFFLKDTAAQVAPEPISTSDSVDYTFETIDVPGVDFLSLTASSDFEDYAGYTKSEDGEKDVAFTLVDGVFETYDVEGSQNTYFFALGNDGTAAGYYEDSAGRHHGVILQDGELQEYNFPDAVETEIYGISDATGALTGNYVDAAGVRRGFSGDTIIEYPGAVTTYADFTSAVGVVGSYIDTEGTYHAYILPPGGAFISFNLSDTIALDYAFVHGINDVGTYVARIKLADDVPRTYIGSFSGRHELRFSDGVSTEGYNINRDGSIVGYYDTEDGRRHGFIARPAEGTTPESVATLTDSGYIFETIDVPGVDFLAVTASSDFEGYAGYTKSEDGQKDVAFTLIDGVFTTYDFPGALNTYFYALGNDGRAAGHYEDSDGLFHGVILENGELRQYDFPDAVETEIYGISDATGALTGNYVDAAGVRRGFSGDIIIEVPGAAATYAGFAIAYGIVGSYVDADGTFHAYLRTPDGKFESVSLSSEVELEYFFVTGINNAGVYVGRSKVVGEAPSTFSGTFSGQQELMYPGSLLTEGWNINQDNSVVGYYDTPDGRRHGFVARPAMDTPPAVDAGDTTPQADTEPGAIPYGVIPTIENYTFETIEVPGVDFLSVTASSDFEDYAGYTKSEDGQKDVAFTLIDGVFTTYDFPGSQNTYFFALGNNGDAAGYYMDSDGRHHGVILQDGALQEYNFPNAVETEIYGISDATGALTGNFTDASGVRRGFSGDEIIEVTGASATFADFVNASGAVVGSYVDVNGAYHPYVRNPNGKYTSVEIPFAESLAYFFIHGLNDTWTYIVRNRALGDVPRTYVGKLLQGLEDFQFSSDQDLSLEQAIFTLRELHFPGGVSTEGWNVNQDDSIVGYYDTEDGRRQGFIARPAEETPAESDVTPPDFGYTFETIDVPGVDFLSVTASSDFEGYAGYTKSEDGEKEVAFTLIDGVFTTYDFPGSQNTYFFALGNNGDAAGYYVNSDGRHHGVILQDGELLEYNFPDAVETEVYGISDATGALTGNFTDADGVRRGFSGDTIIEFPGAAATFADFVNVEGGIVGSSVSAEGVYDAYVLLPNGRFLSLDFIDTTALEYLFLHGTSDARDVVARAKMVDDVPRTYVGGYHGFKELRFPGSVSTEGYNINQDGSIVGHYDSPDGRRHGFIARPTTEAESTHFGNFYTVTLAKGLNMLSVPLSPPKPMTAKNLVALTGATTIITLETASQKFVAWTPGAPDDGFPIEGGKGYIVNVPEMRNFAFVGAPWTDPTAEATAASPAITPLIREDSGVAQEAWAFVVSGQLEGKPTFDGYTVSVRNLRTDSVITTSVQGDYFAAATADLQRRSVIRVGDVIEVHAIGPGGNVESQTLSFKVTPEHLANAVLSVRLDGIGLPTQHLLLQNYPNPFNPETWIPYQLSEDSQVSLSIYDTTGRLIRTLSLGYQSAGFYNSRERAAYWDGRNALGERVASGIYFYQLTTPAFQQTRRLVIVK